MKYFLLTTALLAAAAMAGDQLRDVQAELKSQGFFYGNVDGKEGAETTAAVRRFQIRNGLQVTGSLNEETLGALGVGGGSAEPAKPPVKEPVKEPKKGDVPPKPKPSDQVNPPPPGEAPTTKPRPKDFLREETPRTAPRPSTEDAPPPPRNSRPPLEREDSGIVAPPRGVPPAVQDDFSVFYRGTPYASAPREVQVSVLRRAQEQMGRLGYYRAERDGLPGPSTQEALFDYQGARRLSRTGRLDLQTLSSMSLLPGRSPEAPPLKPFYNPNRRRDSSVDQRGIIR